MRDHLQHGGDVARIRDADAELVTLAWAAREALAKARREPVGLDARVEVVASDDPRLGTWAPLGLSEPWRGWWSREADFVAVVISDSAGSPLCRIPFEG